MELLKQQSGNLYEWVHSKDLSVHAAVAMFAGLSSLYLLKQYTNKKKYKLPPGPKPFPLVGTVLSTGIHNLHLKYMEYAKKYGPVMTFYFGPRRVVVLNDMKSVKEAFVTKGVDFGGRPSITLFDIFSDGGKDIACAQYGPVWKVQRKIAHAALRKYTTGDKIVDLLRTSFNIVTKEMEVQEGPVTIGDWNMLYINNVFSTLCFGREFELDDPFFLKLKERLATLLDVNTDILLADAFPILNSRFYQNKGVRVLTKLIKELIEMFQKEYEEHEAKYDPSNLQDFMDDLIDLRKKSENDKDTQSVLSEMTQMHFLMICLDLFFAGTETTRITLTFVMLYAAKYPEMQKRIHNEIDEIIGKDGEVTLKARDQLHYLHAFLYEVMRFATGAPLSVPHKTMHDTKLGIYDIPKDTMVVANTWAVHFDPSDPDLANFNPDRWLTKDGIFDHQSAPFAPFSMGTRVCVGESLAKVELMVSLALFFQRYTIEVPAGETLSLETEEIAGGLEPKPFKVNMVHRTDRDWGFQKNLIS